MLISQDFYRIINYLLIILFIPFLLREFTKPVYGKMVMPEETQFQQTQQPVELPKHPINGVSPNVSVSGLTDVQNIEGLHQAPEEINGGVKPIIEAPNEFAINGGDGTQVPPPQHQAPHQQQPPMLQKPMFDMPEQSMQFPQMLPPDFNLPGLSAGLNNGPSQMGAQPPFWSNPQPPSAPAEDFFNQFAPSMNGSFPSFPPNMAAPAATALNPVFNQNFMNLPPPHLALNPPNRRSPAGPVYNPSFPPRQTPNMYPLKNFGPQSNGWANNNQAAWNALTPSPWNQLPKRASFSFLFEIILSDTNLLASQLNSRRGILFTVHLT